MNTRDPSTYFRRPSSPMHQCMPGSLDSHHVGLLPLGATGARSADDHEGQARPEEEVHVGHHCQRWVDGPSLRCLLLQRPRRSRALDPRAPAGAVRNLSPGPQSPPATTPPLLTDTTGVLVSRDFAALPAHVLPDVHTIRRLCLTPDRLAAEDTRVLLLQCLKHADPDAPAAPTEPLDLRLAHAHSLGRRPSLLLAREQAELRPLRCRRRPRTPYPVLSNKKNASISLRTGKQESTRPTSIVATPPSNT